MTYFPGRPHKWVLSFDVNMQPGPNGRTAGSISWAGLLNCYFKELRGRNITVNAIAPGPPAPKLFLDGKPQEVIERLSKLAPLERLGQPEDIAKAVAFLAGPDGAWINGQVLRANGGII